MSGFVHNITDKLKHHERKPSEADGSLDGTHASSASQSPMASKSTSNTTPRVASVSTNSSLVDKSLGESHGRQNRLMSGAADLIHKIHHRDSSADKQNEYSKNHQGDETSKNQLKKHDKRQSIDARRENTEHLTGEQQKQREEAQEQARLNEPREMQARYGPMPVNNYAGKWTKEPQIKFMDLTTDDIGKDVFFRARIHNVRKMSAKMVFFLLRQQITNIQALLVRGDTISENMVRWAEHLPVESIVQCRGKIQAPKAKEGEVVGALIHDKEIVIHEIHLVSKLTEHLPFSVLEAEVTEAEANEEGSTRLHVNDKTRLAGRILDLRSTSSQAIFKVQSGVSNLFRSYLDTQGFIEIHSPKLQGGATESGASVFKVDYFGRTAFLAQSPQLAKQMSIASDFGKVYEVGAVFRAENSNTHRHLTEYTGLDVEMAIEEHYWEVRNLIDRTLKSIFKGVYERFPKEIEAIKRQFPHEDLVWLDETPILPFKEAITMLNETGWLGEDGKPLPLDEDLGTRDEIQLGRMMKEKFKTDYYIIDKFPASARPFYTMPDPEDPMYTNSFDIFVRGQEITTGGQRIHDAEMLIRRMHEAKVDPKTMEEYMQGFEWAAPPHAGAGIGLERICMLLLQLGDIRHASLYPRDPKSLPARAKASKLHHPESSTLRFEGDKKIDHRELQPLEHLIANYGDASNTSWLEPRMKIWRDSETGAAVGWSPLQGFAMTVGDPLCDESQYMKVMSTYLDYIKHETELKPLWLLCGSAVAEILADPALNSWRTFSCAAEQRVDLKKPLKALTDREVMRKIRHATTIEGIKIHDIEMGTSPSPEFRKKIDQRVEDWLAARKEHQHVHLTDVHPWQDVEHRQYHYATDKTHTICTLVILALLSPEHGWQVKFSLDFPNAPSGAIEATVIHALTAIKNKGAVAANFGGGASTTFTPGANLKGAKVKMLSKAYHTISTELKLVKKSEFREKLGAINDPTYVCYPPKGFGPKGVHAILSFFED